MECYIGIEATMVGREEFPSIFRRVWGDLWVEKLLRKLLTIPLVGMNPVVFLGLHFVTFGFEEGGWRGDSGECPC